MLLCSLCYGLELKGSMQVSFCKVLGCNFIVLCILLHERNSFCFVSLQQQRPDLPRLLVSTATVDDFLSLSLCLSLSLLIACCVLVCLLHVQAGWLFTW